MAIVAGIDEAGYGPLLGPLIVTSVAFEVGSTDRCLWDVLRESITATPAKGDARLRVIDSKKLYDRKAGIGALERTALVMLAAAGRHPRTLRDLLRLTACDALHVMDDYPWYRGFDVALPSDPQTGDIGTRTTPLRRDMSAQAARLRAVYCDAVLEGRFNQLVDLTRNKAAVLLSVVLRLIGRILSLGAPETVIHVDRQGGRTSYRAHLMTALPDYAMEVIEESDLRSAYVLTHGPRRIWIDFSVEGERQHMPVALASIYSKYLRELFMTGLNRFWQERVSGLTPTAGYYTDGQRFLRDIESAISRHAIDRNWLVRSR